MVTKGQRKVRSDAKKDVKPTLPIELKDAIYRLAYITKTPIMHVAEQLFLHSIYDVKINESVSVYFQRQVRINNILYRGSLSNTAVTKRTKESKSERIHFRVTKGAYETLAVFAYALSCSHAKACALLLEECIHDADFISNYVENHLEGDLSSERMKELREFMHYVNDGEDVHSWASLLSYITDEVKKPFKATKDLVNEFIIHHWKNN